MRRALIVLPVLAALALVAANAFGTKSRGAHVVAFDVGGLQQIAVIPPKAAPAGKRPLVLFLYGRGGHASDQLSNQTLFDTLKDLGPQAPVFVFAESNDHSYWHDRAERHWASFLEHRVVKQAIGQFGIDPARIAVGGISMGGFGAYNLARQFAGKFCAVGGHSPAIWTSSNQTAPGAFDNAADFDRNDVVHADPKLIARTPHLWLDAGTGDPFDAGDRALIARLRSVKAHLVVHRWPGGHTGDYWAAHWEQYIRYYARALSDCPTAP